MKRYSLLIAAILLVITAVPVLADSCPPCLAGEAETSGGSQSGVLVRERFSLTQDKYLTGATDLHFKLWQKEDYINVQGWKVCISDFVNATSQRGNQPEPYHSQANGSTDPDNGQHAVDVNAVNPTSGVIAYNSVVTVSACFWLSNWNTKRMADVNWTQGSDEVQALPNFGWVVSNPEQSPGGYDHQLIIQNDDPSGTVTLNTVSVSVDSLFIDDLSTVVFSQVLGSGIVLGPGDSTVFTITTPTSFVGGHIYGKVELQGSGGGSAVDIFDHVVPDPSRVPSLTNWGLIVLIILLILAAIPFVRRQMGVGRQV